MAGFTFEKFKQALFLDTLLNSIFWVFGLIATAVFAYLRPFLPGDTKEFLTTWLLAFFAFAVVASLVRIAWRIGPVRSLSASSDAALSETVMKLAATLNEHEEQMKLLHQKADAAARLASVPLILRALEIYAETLEQILPPIATNYTIALRTIAGWDGRGERPPLLSLDKLDLINQKITYARRDLMPQPFSGFPRNQPQAALNHMPVDGEPDGLNDAVKYWYREIHTSWEAYKSAVAKDLVLVQNARASLSTLPGIGLGENGGVRDVGNPPPV